MGLLGVPYCSTLPKIFRCLCALWGDMCMGSSRPMNLPDLVTFSRVDECRMSLSVEKQMFFLWIISWEEFERKWTRSLLECYKWLI